MSNKSTRINRDRRKASKGSLSNLCRAFLSDLELTHDRRRKISSYRLARFWSFVSLACVIFGFPHKGRASDPPGATSSITGTVRVITGQGQANNLAGVAVKLNDSSAGSASQSVLTDENGGFRFAQLGAGAYTLEVNAEGFKPWTKTVALGQGQAAAEDATLEISTVDERIEVQGQDLDVSTHGAETTGTVTNSQLETLPLPQQKFTDALPLSPGVIRTPEGRVSFNGQAENQGILVVNSTEAVDPVTGSFAIPVPVDVIQSMSVHSSPDTAEFGGFSGGLTEIEIRPALDTWNFKLHDMSPSFRAENGHLIGIGAFTPRMVFGGPLIKDKLNFTEELTYEVRNHAVRGLSWPFNETKTRSVTSFTQLQFILSPRHLLDVNLNVFPLQRRYADINALVPQTASNTYGQNGVSVGISDSYQLGAGGLLNTVVRYTRFDSHAHGQGAEDMLVTPDGWGGNFFDSWSRNANELEVRPAFQFPDKSWHGRHEFKIGVDVSRRSFAGTDISRPINVLRQDNSVAEQITFQGRGLQNGASTEVGEFIEDHWILDSHMAIDMGARLSSQSIGRSAALGPHIGVAYSPRQNGRTIIRASAGTVYGHVPLLADTFLEDPTRVISFFDPSGKAIRGPISLQNAYLQSDGGSGPQFVSALPRSSPRTFTWSVEVEREIRRNVSLKVGYLDSQTRNLFVVDPLISATQSGSVLALANNGTERYRRIEATLHARPFEHGDLNVSYVWSRSRGDLNTLAETYMPFEEPVIRPNATGILPSDVPHRIVTWGIFSLPWKLTFSPVVDVRTGLPYSNVDTLQNYVGVPNSMRFPTFFSLDGRIYREFPLRLPFREKSTKRKIRLGVYTNNLTNHGNFHDVYNNVTSPLFGRFAGFYHRTDGFVIDIVD
jgi:hypothetical protein